MKKKLDVKSDIKQSLKKQLIICFVLSTIVIAGLLIASKIIDIRKLYKYTIVDDINLIKSIESIKFEKNKLILNGYAFMLDCDSDDSSIYIFLRNVDTEEEIWLDTEQITRPDVDIYFDSEYDYSNSGFIASTNADKLNRDASYEIILSLDYNKLYEKVRRTVSSGTYIMNDRLFSYNPNKFNFFDMNIESELLTNIFENGHLCFYQEDVEMYVYQYLDKLYWVVANDFNINDSDTIIYHVHTSQSSVMTENNKQDKFINMDFVFEQYEITDEITDSYRIAVRDIPDNAVTYITTGVYNIENNKSVWTKSFQLNNIIK